jgi:hypothetical protein
MTPYVNLQEEIIRILKKMLETDPRKLKNLAKRFCVENTLKLSAMDIKYFSSLGFNLPDDIGGDWVEKTIPEIIKQQIDITGKRIVIRNLLGMELCTENPIEYAEFINHRGTGNNHLRTYYFSQPGVLKKGDILANGDRLLSPPREGGNGSVLLHLTGGFDGHWIDVPARIPIALLITELGAPPELVEK